MAMKAYTQQEAKQAGSHQEDYEQPIPEISEPPPSSITLRWLPWPSKASPESDEPVEPNWVFYTGVKANDCNWEPSSSTPDPQLFQGYPTWVKCQHCDRLTETGVVCTMIPGRTRWGGWAVRAFAEQYICREKLCGNVIARALRDPCGREMQVVKVAAKGEIWEKIVRIPRIPVAGEDDNLSFLEKVKKMYAEDMEKYWKWRGRA
ncbi:hypothetical protein BJ508DRAFT_379191 [Ascobolus immersus RN42]|uniref:Uncharacterized protein n=1 Tax=Ascobolus immersus RN42 TaxID=1160509 RepID=A0A3N4HUP7_ASCIM|nr:hypothetical protein BJ508DRAFT_379191 [Ascobolus immersus RN42]